MINAKSGLKDYNKHSLSRHAAVNIDAGAGGEKSGVRKKIKNGAEPR